MSLPDHLIDSSFFTATQIESLTAYRQVVTGNMTLKQVASMRQRGPVKIGSFYRTVKQGKKNISQAIVTLVIALWLGFVKPEDIRRLLDQAGRTIPNVGEYEIEHVSAIIEDIANKIVM